METMETMELTPDLFEPLDSAEKNSEFIAAEPRTYLSDAWHRFRKNKLALCGLVFLVIMVILGGRGSLTGTILAGLLMLPLPELLRFGSAEQWRMVLYGFLVVIVILFRPAGIMGTRELTMNDLKSLVGWVKGKFSKNSLKISRKE